MDADGESRSGRVLEWEIGLPSASELTPLWHPLITPALATAFRINIAGGAFDDFPYAHDSPTSHLSFLFDEDDGEVEEGEEEEGPAAETEDAASGSCACRGGRPRKKARMVWTPELHHRFVEAVAHLGDKGAVPKAIVRLMNVEGLTRENVASHLQKYRIYLKRTHNTSMPQPLPPFSTAYAPPFNPQPPPSGTSNRSGYCAFPSRDSEDLERDQAVSSMGFKFQMLSVQQKVKPTEGVSVLAYSDSFLHVIIFVCPNSNIPCRAAFKCRYI
ncbi:hypothetical protein HU200_026095 [Digitaria exilis]|uniref:HTH myb-type domain-containing protein n=1 Tax=Digitaria exilis TaxID=1010633 RepID=A0A835BW36_9POAL|nr:hypothetical protein HU200_026095 [Digitaria exilis]